MHFVNYLILDCIIRDEITLIYQWVEHLHLPIILI